VTARRALVARRAEFASEVIDATPYRSRAAELVQSGDLDRACKIATLSHELADAVIQGMEAERAARRCRGALLIRELRGAAFEAIARTIIQRLEQKGHR
jgi:hypothetical protein